MKVWTPAPYTGVVRTCPKCTGHRLSTSASVWQTENVRLTYILCRTCGHRFKLSETKPDLSE